LCASAYANNVDAIEEVAISKEVKIVMTSIDDGLVKAVVTTVTTENGESSTNYESFEGTEEEVQIKLDALSASEDDIKIMKKKIIKEIEEEVEN
jgi:K(+)-stimulated pyrophosphate-energized sodium pump